MLTAVVKRPAAAAAAVAQPELLRPPPEQRVQKREVRYDDGDEGLAAGPDAACDDDVGTGLFWGERE